MNGEFYYHPCACRFAVIVVQVDDLIIDLVFRHLVNEPEKLTCYLMAIMGAFSIKFLCCRPAYAGVLDNSNKMGVITE